MKRMMIFSYFYHGVYTIKMIIMILILIHPITCTFIQSTSIVKRHFDSFPCIRLLSSSRENDNTNNNINDIKTQNQLPNEVQELLSRAKKIRDSLPPSASEPTTTQAKNSPSSSPQLSRFNIQFQQEEETLQKCEYAGYRLYIDIGRENGTWMDPRWGASGRRIEFTIDILFLIGSKQQNQQQGTDTDIAAVDVRIENDPSIADPEVINQMVKDNLSGISSIVRNIISAPKARLRNGFDEMKVYNGGYRIDKQQESNKSSSSNTLRFYLNVDGTTQENNTSSSSYGDIFVPKGNLYFSLPCFGNSVQNNNLSSKEGIVTVRQVGWHTGWRREESRIVGVFRAVPLDQAKLRDKF